MGKSDRDSDWFDDFMIMKAVEDEKDPRSHTSGNTSNIGCLSIVIGAIIFLTLVKLIG